MLIDVLGARAYIYAPVNGRLTMYVGVHAPDSVRTTPNSVRVHPTVFGRSSDSVRVNVVGLCGPHRVAPMGHRRY